MQYEWMQKVGGRRFILSLASLFVGSWLLISGYIESSIYRDIVIATVGAYILGNTWQKKQDESNVDTTQDPRNDNRGEDEDNRKRSHN